MRVTDEQVDTYFAAYARSAGIPTVDRIRTALQAVFDTLPPVIDMTTPNLQGRVFWEESAEVTPEAWVNLGNMLPIRTGDIVKLPGGGEATILHPDHVAAVRGEVEIAKSKSWREDANHLQAKKLGKVVSWPDTLNYSMGIWTCDENGRLYLSDLPEHLNPVHDIE